LHLPLILTFHLSISNYLEVKKYFDVVDFCFGEEIKIKNKNYKFIFLILYKTDNHYVSLFKNSNPDLKINNIFWHFYDDLKGYIVL